MSHGRLRRLLAGLTTLGAALLCTALPAAAAPVEGALPPDTAVGEGAPPLPPSLQSASWLVTDLTGGTVLAARAGSAKRAPASTQKILTALSVAGELPAEVEATTADTEVDGRTVGLVPGVRYPSAELLDALFVSSGNDVALALARAAGAADPVVAGDRMTETARSLGAQDTTAANPTGLDADGQLTTPYDLAVLTRAALADPTIRRSASLTSATLHGSDGRTRSFDSSNPLLGRYPGALGVKTGSTAEAGQTFVGAAERDGVLLAVVLMDAPASFGTEATRLLDWGFAARAGTQPLATLPAADASAPAAPPSDPAVAPLAADEGGISPLLALALAVTVVAAAFTYWQGHEPPRRRRPEEPRRAVRLPGEPAGTGAPPATAPDQSSSSPRESRRIFAP